MNNNTRNALLIAAPKSNSGKTLITLGLMHALVKRGLKVQPFKCGPDYIDAMHHSKISGRPSYNLDLWMAEKSHVTSVFSTQLEKSDVAIVEGVMGLFDGAQKDTGSSAAIARHLNLPVILVVDASSVAYSVAPLLYGFKNFDKRVNLAGVIFNKVAGESHFQFLKEAAHDADVDVLGYVPKDDRLAIESRHLGLHLPGEHKNVEIVDMASSLIEKHVNIDLLLSLSTIQAITPPPISPLASDKKLTIALAQDEAFNFSYQTNKNILNEVGTITEFSPLNDESLPAAELIWLPGGYPELFAQKLAQNTLMLDAIKKHVKAGKALIAECGGMMYLGKQIVTKTGDSFGMTSVFDFETSFKDMKLHLGYRELSGDGINVRGHEFHYSNIIGNEKASSEFTSKTARNTTIDMPVYRTQNCWASYMHLYLENKDKLQNILSALGL